jgi:hypothetical protein
MDRPEVLSNQPVGRSLVIWVLCGFLFVLMSTRVHGSSALAALDQLTPIDQYRQLNLILMVSEGAEEPFLQGLQALSPAPLDQPASSKPLPLLEVDDFQTPLNRIVDQRATLANAARLFEFANNNGEAIQLKLAQLAAATPQEVMQMDLIQLAEDAIIIRTALTGSIEYQVANSDPVMSGYLQTYKAETVHLRNVMVYWSFDQELAAITNEAMDDTGGRMEAYQRMLEDEPNLDTLKQHLQAVELMYEQITGRKRKVDKIPHDKLILQESQVP